MKIDATKFTTWSLLILALLSWGIGIAYGVYVFGIWAMQPTTHPVFRVIFLIFIGFVLAIIGSELDT